MKKGDEQVLVFPFEKGYCFIITLMSLSHVLVFFSSDQVKKYLEQENNVFSPEMTIQIREIANKHECPPSTSNPSRFRDVDATWLNQLLNLIRENKILGFTGFEITERRELGN